jgi:hypothetical protein
MVLISSGQRFEVYLKENFDLVVSTHNNFAKIKYKMYHFQDYCVLVHEPICSAREELLAN